MAAAEEMVLKFDYSRDAACGGYVGATYVKVVCISVMPCRGFKLARCGKHDVSSSIVGVTPFTDVPIRIYVEPLNIDFVVVVCKSPQ